MKKNYFLVVLMLLIGASLQAKQIDVNKAKTIAANFLQQQSLTRSANGDLQLAYTATDNGSATRAASSANLFYVFNSGKSDGFVVVAGDDQMRPVLGYTLNGSFDINTANDGLLWWLSAITAKAKAVANGTDKSTFTSTRTTGSVEPIVKTHWSQSSPYNDLCPVDNTDGNGSNSVTGCVATAMAQLLYTCFAGTQQTLTGIATCRPEAHASSTQDVDLSQFTIDYSKMDLKYDGDESDESKNAVAQLMYACGLSVNMNYCSSSSGSNGSSYTFMKHFGIDQSCTTAHRGQYTSDEWDALIRSELDNGRAVLYSGQTLDYSGHAFICDGYDTDGLYHINWGWGGYNDGYFDFYSLDFDYVNNQGAICGIKPGTAQVDLTDVLSYESLLVVDATLPIENPKYLNCVFNNIYCYGQDFNGVVGLALCNSDGTIVKTLYTEEMSIQMNSYSYFNRGIDLPSDLADGTYELRIVAGLTAGNLKVIKGDGSYSHLTVTVSGGNITVSGYQPEAAQLSLDSFTVGGDGCGYVNQTTPIILSIKNNGGEFLGTIEVDGNASAKACIKAGETKQITVEVTPTTEGTQTFQISAFADNNATGSISLGEVNVEVKSAEENVPYIVVQSCKMQNSELTLGEKATLELTLRNDGAMYDGYIYASYEGTWQSGFTSWTLRWNSNTTPLSLSKGSSTTLYIDVDYSRWEERCGELNHAEFNVKSLSYYINNGWATLGSAEDGSVASFTVEKEKTGIEPVAVSTGIEAYVLGSSLIVNGTADSDIIRIYSVGGALVKSVKAEGSSTQIDGMAGGQSYVVSVKGKNVKIVL